MTTNFLLSLFRFSILISSCEFISCKKLLYYVRMLSCRNQYFSSPRSLWFHPCSSQFRLRLFFSCPHSFQYCPRPLRYHSHPFIFRSRPFIFFPHPFIFRPRSFTFCLRLFQIFKVQVIYICAYRTDVCAHQIYVNVCKNIVRAYGFASVPNEVLSVYSSILSVSALMHLRLRIHAKQLPHAPEGL